MRGVELTIAIGSALGLLLMMVADAAQQRMGVATPPPPTTISIEDNARTPAVAPANCVPGGDEAEQAVWAAAVDAACSAAPVSTKGKVG